MLSDMRKLLIFMLLMMNPVQAKNLPDAMFAAARGQKLAVTELALVGLSICPGIRPAAIGRAACATALTRAMNRESAKPTMYRMVRSAILTGSLALMICAVAGSVRIRMLVRAGTIVLLIPRVLKYSFIWLC